MRQVHEILTELRAHPDCAAVIIWQPYDAESVGADPTRIDWGQVEDDMTERGWDSIDTLKHNYEYDDECAKKGKV